MKVAKLKEPGRYADGHGLYLQVSQWGTKAWIFRFMKNGRARHMGLGPLHTLTLQEARERARKARQALLDGIDPIEDRTSLRLAARAEAAKRMTFKEAAEKYIAAHRAGWKNEKHADQWEATLSTYAYPVIGNLSVADIEIGHITRILEPIWTEKTETASRVRGRIEAVLDWASVRGHRTGENPARWRGHLEKILPSKTKVRAVRHMPAMPYAEVGAFVRELRDVNSISAQALEFTILTACRTAEVTDARWDEIDFAKKIWTVPGERTKSGRPHRVPLSPRAIEILKTVPRIKGNPFVFHGAREGQHLSNMAMLEALRERRDRTFTVHGFRSTFRDWAAEQTNFPREIAEAALAHVLGDKTEAAYQRGDLLEKRRKLMEAWAGFCARPAPIAGNVRGLRAIR
ncbi:MAG: integrase arm-type DNA-binding domain-containing protein [Hyphomicrobium sp.]|nr:integrase arm-type DNA-binding domain-containing protein [Hyphomicrobium sp.]